MSFDARKSNGEDVEGRCTYEQEFMGSAVFVKGRVTCFEVYDTPVLMGTPDVPAMTRNRAKWGGIIEQSNFPDDPFVGIGRFARFQSIDNGEAAGEPSDLSTLAGFGDESANEAFCNSDAVPNPNFGPHPLDGGNSRSGRRPMLWFLQAAVAKRARPCTSELPMLLSKRCCDLDRRDEEAIDDTEEMVWARAGSRSAERVQLREHRSPDGARPGSGGGG